jgi:hypothetical protein
MSNHAAAEPLPVKANDSNGSDDIFSKEALQHQAGYRERGAILLRQGHWGRCAPLILVAFVGSLSIFASIVRVPRYLDCPGVVIDGTMLLSCPVRYHALLEPGLAATVEVHGYGALPGTFAVSTVGAEYSRGAGGPRIPVRVRLRERKSSDEFWPTPGMKGTGSVIGPPRRLLFALLDQLD